MQTNHQVYHRGRELPAPGKHRKGPGRVCENCGKVRYSFCYCALGKEKRLEALAKGRALTVNTQNG